ncbi:7-deoxyloganetin glucosyltransferase-like [Panicum miliaceum]|uniref:7-deoxyloganetin glucosyltransferase-like n=1 Tax=Panicum miliaceum TaxID=4540 RepID=A0A3L6QID6_PANMI|nr:7-deoxyloganetin glucosyltransferase-like [Panicum miliaceum]
MARPHVVVVPYPGSGNINPVLQLAKLLHRHGVYVTFVNTEHNRRRVQATEGAGAGAVRDESYLTNGYLEKTVIDWIPGMPPICLGDFSSFLRTTNPNDFGLRFNESEANKCTTAGALILNTFDSLEADVLAALRAEYPRMYTVGPLGSLLRQNLDSAAADDSTGLSLWKQDAGCLAWLEAQEPRSVVYVNFGSHTVLTPEQLAEFAWDNLVCGGGPAVLPPDFTAATAGRCHVTAWCPQEQVLRHPAVGCFLTHSGWNSTCESVSAGVPMVCWPGFSDQYTNCKYACEVWGVGVRLDAEVRREQVAAHVREAMGSEVMRRRAAKRKEEAETATSPGGSSSENLLSMVRELSSGNNEEVKK